MDRRPAGGAIVLVTSASRLYTVDVRTGRAAAIGQGPLAPVAATDGKLAYAAGDVGAGIAPFVIGSACTNSVPTATSTQLFDIESSRDALVLQDPPNAGGLKTVGALGIAVTNPAGFDISAGSGTALLATRVAGRKGSRLYTVALDTGATKLVGRIGPARRPVTLRGLAFS